MSFVVRKSGLPAQDIRSIIDRTIADAGHGAIEGLMQRLSQPSDAWGYYPRDPLARIVHHRLAPAVLTDPPNITGAGYLDAVRGRAAIFVANHLSYSDANVIEFLLHQCGHREIADRLAVIAGPKVYSDLSRRFSSLCFGTIKSPQSEGVSSGEAEMPAREVARAAKQTLQTAHDRLATGDVILLFPEGSRSRTGEMQRFLAGVSRYFDSGETLIVPIGLTGTEHMFAIGEERLGSARITMNVGEPFTVASVRRATGTDRRSFVDAIGTAVAELLPIPFRGAYR